MISMKAYELINSAAIKLKQKNILSMLSSFSKIKENDNAR